MLTFDTSSMLFVTVWSLAAVAVGLTCGYFIGRWYTMHAEPKRLRRDREKTLAAMVKLLDSTKELNQDVDATTPHSIQQSKNWEISKPKVDTWISRQC